MGDFNHGHIQWESLESARFGRTQCQVWAGTVPGLGGHSARFAGRSC